MTLQWMIASEALNRSLHHKGEHAMATSLRDCFGNTTVYHIIYTISRNRHPTIGALKKGSGLDCGLSRLRQLQLEQPNQPGRCSDECHQQLLSTRAL